MSYPKYLCYNIEKDEYFECKKDIACASNNFKAEFSNLNFSNSMGLYCENEVYINIFFSTLIFSAAFLIFFVINTADYFGRKKTFLGVLMTIIVLFVASMLLFNLYYPILIIYSIIYGLFDGALILLIIFFCESTNKIFQNSGCNIIALFSPLAGIVFNFFIPYNMKYFLIFMISFAMLLFFLILIFLYESIYYLNLNKKNNQILDVCKNISKFNKIYSIDFINDLYEIIKIENKVKNHSIKYKLKNLFKKGNLKNLLGLIWINIYIIFIYNLIFISIGQENNNNFIRLKNIIVNSIEFLNYIVMSFVNIKIYRKWTWIVLSILSLIVSIFLFFFDNIIAILIIVYVVLKSINCIFGSILFVYQNELFKTIIRSLGVGISVFFGRIISSVAPILFISNFYNTFVFSFYANLILIPALFLMKETKYQVIQD